MFSCMKCDAEITRSADRMGKPHPSAVLIELEAPSISDRQQCETFFQRKRGFPAATTSLSPMIVGEKGIICEED